MTPKRGALTLVRLAHPTNCLPAARSSRILRLNAVRGPRGGVAVGKAIRVRPAAAAVAALAWLLPGGADGASCPSKSEAALEYNKEVCAGLEQRVRQPSAPLDQYERTLAEYLTNMCHRNVDAGWVPDKRI